jgi:hypothetical protein
MEKFVHGLWVAGVVLKALSFFLPAREERDTEREEQTECRSDTVYTTDGDTLKKDSVSLLNRGK